MKGYYLLPKTALGNRQTYRQIFISDRYFEGRKRLSEHERRIEKKRKLQKNDMNIFLFSLVHCVSELHDSLVTTHQPSSSPPESYQPPVVPCLHCMLLLLSFPVISCHILQLMLTSFSWFVLSHSLVSCLLFNTNKHCITSTLC